MAYNKTIGLHSEQGRKAQRLWTALLSTVTCATVLGMPSMMTGLNLRAIMLMENAAIAQTATPPVLPTSLPQGSSLKIDGSGSLAAVNQALKEKYEAKYSGTSVTLGTGGTAAGLKALEEGKIDLASIGRDLTEEELNKGFVAIPIKREKIAMLVSEDNPFRGSLTIQQFAKIFRGEITNWKEVGGPDAPIQLVDQPEASDTRNAFPGYPVFKSAPFRVSAKAVVASSENPEVIAAQLGPNGLSYITADGMKNLKGVRTLDMHKTQPDDPRYPFSQPIAYVYKKGRQLTPATQAFLAYLGTEEAKDTIKSASAPSAVIENPNASIRAALDNTAASVPATNAVSPNPVASPVVAVSSNTASNNAASNNIASNNTTTPVGTVVPGTADATIGFPWWPLLILGLLGAGLAWWLLKKRAGTAADQVTNPPSTTDLPTTVPTALPTTPLPTTPLPDTKADLSGTGSLDTALPTTDTPSVGGEVDIAPPIADTTVISTAGIAGIAAIATGDNPIVDNDPNDLIVENAPRQQSASAILPDSDDGTRAIDHDIAAHGPGTVQVNPRDTAGNSGGLMFPAIDPLTGSAAIAGTVVTGGIIAGAVAGIISNPSESDRASQTDPNSLNIGEIAAISSPQNGAELSPPPVPAITLPHEPITQLPPNVHPPIDLSETMPQSIQSPNPSDQPNNNVIANTDANVADNANLANLVDNTDNNEPISSNLPIGAAAAVGIAAGIALGRTTDPLTPADLADVDANLPDLPQGYGESRIILMTRDPQWGYTYWDIPDDHRQAMRNQGGQQLALRLYDVTDLNINNQNPHSLQQYSCDELARDWYLPIPVSDREYITEIGYLTATGAWLLMARSNTVRIPPVYPSDWMDDQFITVDWEDNLQSRTFLQLVPPGSIVNAPQVDPIDPSFDNPVFGVSQADQASRMAGSLFGSMHQIPAETLSSFVFPSGAGMWANEWGNKLVGESWNLPTPSGMGMSGVGYRMSGVGMVAASMPPERSRKFWLVADAELIIYGATEPDAQLTIGGVPVQLSPEGTFRLQMSFQDGNLDFPIMAIAKDGEQMRQIRMTFDRSTPLRKTNTKDEAQDEQY